MGQLIGRLNIFWKLMTGTIHWPTDNSPITNTDPPNPSRTHPTWPFLHAKFYTLQTFFPESSRPLSTDPMTIHPLQVWYTLRAVWVHLTWQSKSKSRCTTSSCSWLPELVIAMRFYPFAFILKLANMKVLLSKTGFSQNSLQIRREHKD